MKTLLALILVMTISSTASAKSFTLATGDYRPFCSKHGGVAMDIVTAALQSVGANAKYVILPWVRCEAGVERGDFVGTFPYSKNESRIKKFLFTNGILNTSAVFFMLKDSMPNWDYGGVNSLEGLRVACIKGYFYETLFTKNEVNCQPVTDIKDAFQMLIRGRIDLVAESEAIGWMMIEDIDSGYISKIREANTPLRSGVSSVMVSKIHPDSEVFIKLFNKGIQKIKSNGVYDAILERYHLLD